MGIVIFNNISSKEVGVEVETFPTYNVPEKVYQTISVPGRNGDVVFDTKTFRNVPRNYKVGVVTFGEMTYSQKMSQVAEWLHSASGYARLEDSYDEEFFRLAYFNSSLSIENLFDEAGRAEIPFICKPQRYYKSGELPILFETTGQIQNGTKYDALPILNITTDDTAGTVSIGSYNFGILAGSGTHITMDCELQDAYYNTENKNSFIVLNGADFPKLVPGLSTISFTGGVQSVEVIPRWWTV